MDAKEFGGLPILSGLIRNGLKAILLLGKGADVNMRDFAGRAPLMWAIQSSNVEGVQLLLKDGANVTIAAGNGETALKLATKAKEGAEQRLVLARNRPQPWMAERAAACQKIVDLLREKGATE